MGFEPYPFVSAGVGGYGLQQPVDSGVVSLSTSGATTDLGISIPVGALIVAVQAKITTAIAGVSVTGTSVNLDFISGCTASGINFVTNGNGNVGVTHKANIYDYNTITSTNVVASAADLRLSITGGADNIPSAGAVRAIVYYWLLTGF